MKDDLKLIIIILIGFCLLVSLSSCGKNKSIFKGFARGTYEGTKQMQEMKKDDSTFEPVNELPSYDQYERERQEMLKTTNNDKYSK